MARRVAARSLQKYQFGYFVLDSVTLIWHKLYRLRKCS